MDQNQEFEATRSPAEMASTALGVADDTSKDSPLPDIGTQAVSDARSPDDVATAPAEDIEDQAHDSQPEQVVEMAPPALTPAKRGRGRPRKNPLQPGTTPGSAKATTPASNLDDSMSLETPPAKRRRGRPPKKNNAKPSPSTVTTPARVRSDLDIEPEFSPSPLSTGQRDLRVPTASDMDRDEWLNEVNQATGFVSINGHQERGAATIVGNPPAADNAFSQDLKFKLRQALFENAKEYNGGVRIPDYLAQSLHSYLGAGLPPPRGELFIRAELVDELRGLFEAMDAADD
ncbi:hypothetical protein PG987_009176 [Apiospora arundinis]